MEKLLKKRLAKIMLGCYNHLKKLCFRQYRSNITAPTVQLRDKNAISSRPKYLTQGAISWKMPLPGGKYQPMSLGGKNIKSGREKGVKCEKNEERDK
jgi:hypothetical protein